MYRYRCISFRLIEDIWKCLATAFSEESTLQQCYDIRDAVKANADEFVTLESALSVKDPYSTVEIPLADFFNDIADTCIAAKLDSDTFHSQYSTKDGYALSHLKLLTSSFQKDLCRGHWRVVAGLAASAGKRGECRPEAASGSEAVDFGQGRFWVE